MGAGPLLLCVLCLSANLGICIPPPPPGIPLPAPPIPATLGRAGAEGRGIWSLRGGGSSLRRAGGPPGGVMRVRGGGWGIDNDEHYQSLGLNRHTVPSQAEIKKAYKRQALKLHPDKNPEKDRARSEASFKKLSEAYEVLSDPERRRRYDRFGTAADGAEVGGYGDQGSRGNGGGGEEEEDLSWRQFFGGGFFQGGIPPGAVPPELVGESTVRKDLWLSLEELFRGGVHVVKARVYVYVSRGGYAVQTERRLNVMVKRGWKDGTRLTFKEPHDLQQVVVTVRQRRHKTFRREGNDLVVECTLSPAEARWGTTALVPRVGGGSIELRIKADSRMVNEDKHKRIPSEGMPIKGGPARGDLVVVFAVRGWLRRRVLRPVQHAAVQGGKLAVGACAAYVLLGRPMRTLRWGWTLATRLMMFAALVATYSGQSF